MVDGVEWWSTAEVAAYLGVARNTLTAYRSRGQVQLPEPTYFGKFPMWKRAEIEAWAGSRG